MTARTTLPNLWASPHGFLHRDRFLRQAAEEAAAHAVPAGGEELADRLQKLRETLTDRLHLRQEPLPLDLEFHGEVAREGYKVQKVSFASAPGIRVTGNLYLPDGEGPFPAVVNLHGHWSQGKIAARVQERGHALAAAGFATLTVDAAGSGERGEEERKWSYHGGARAGELFLAGDSLLGLQVRDNRRALDVLQSLPMIDGEKLGATGASGGGNQTMWLAALDDRVKAAVPVVSVGSFRAYVGASNCVCETLPGGLRLAEEWMVLGLIAPRALLIMNALHDQPAFGYGPMSSTCRQLEEVYSLCGARERFDSRLIDMTHGYWPAPRRAMVNWMKYWLAGDARPVSELSEENPIPEEELLCYPPGARPKGCRYGAVREKIAARVGSDFSGGDEARAREELTRMIGWKTPAAVATWTLKRTTDDGMQVGSVLSPRGLPLPVVAGGDWKRDASEVRLLLSPEGKSGTFVMGQWAEAVAAGVPAVAMDLPAVGELAWEPDVAGETCFHNSARAALWLGETLAGEWAEAVAAVLGVLREKSPQARIHVLAEGEAAFAVLLAQALQPDPNLTVTESGVPPSLRGPMPASLVWAVPGFLAWGDLDDLRNLAKSGSGAS